MSKKGISDGGRTLIVLEVDPMECPFREFRDNELHPEFWGMGPAAFRTAFINSKAGFKPQAEHIWLDDQTQPLPRSARQYLNGWVRAEELAMSRWDAETAVFEENDGGKMSVIDIQLSHAQVILRSSFCRKVLSACFLLERADTFVVEHQWENFSFSMAPEGWRPRYHIYSPGVKPGGGQQHRPGLSKNGWFSIYEFINIASLCINLDSKKYHQSSSSTAYLSPMLDIGLSKCTPLRSILGYSNPAPASHLAQIVTPSRLRTSYTTFA
ncbi:hypothetical protein evm_009422 [Chilo suppressalis]|nr:hypothetical protein evm_009422 [Chilo suppressalis]